MFTASPAVKAAVTVSAGATSRYLLDGGGGYKQPSLGTLGQSIYTLDAQRLRLRLRLRLRQGPSPYYSCESPTTRDVDFSYRSSNRHRHP